MKSDIKIYIHIYMQRDRQTVIQRQSKGVRERVCVREKMS